MGINRRNLFLSALVGAVAMPGVTEEEARAIVNAEKSPTERENEAVGNQNDHYLNTQPVPFYDYSAPRDVMIQLMNALIPSMPNTWTVLAIPGIGFIDITPTKGFPIPFGLQLTNPEYMRTNNAHKNADSSTLPQPEPDGLYRSGTTDATWILSINDEGYVTPEYHEELVLCYPFEVALGADGRIQRVGQKVSSVTIDLSKAGS